MRNNKCDVFISYSRKNQKDVFSFVQFLESNGYSVWIDKDSIETGDTFRENIVNAIRESKVFLFFSSAASNASRWTISEIGVARDEGKKIIPIRLDDTQYNDSIRLELSNKDFVNYEPDHEFAKQKVLKSLSTIIRPSGNVEIVQNLTDDSFSFYSFIVFLKKFRGDVGSKVSLEVRNDKSKTIFCIILVAIVGLLVLWGIISGIGNQTEKTNVGADVQSVDSQISVLNNYVNDYNSQYVGGWDQSLASLEIYMTPDYVVFPYLINEDSDGIFSGIADKHVERASLINWLRNTSYNSIPILNIFCNAKMGVKVVYIGNKSLTTDLILIKKEELDLIRK